MAALQHPNVVYIYGVINDGPKLGIVEEFMSSGSLRRLLNLHQREMDKEEGRLRGVQCAGGAGAGGVAGGGRGGGGGGGEGEGRQVRPLTADRRAQSKHLLSSKVRVQCSLDVARGMVNPEPYAPHPNPNPTCLNLKSKILNPKP
jgi:hypothetical protein